MTLCLLLPSPEREVVVDRLERAFPGATISAPLTAEELNGALASEPFDVVVFSGEQLSFLSPAALRAASDAELILTTNALSELDALLASGQSPARVADFLVYGAHQEPDQLATEVVARVDQAFRRAQMTAQERQQQEAIARSLHEIVYRLDADGRFVYLNEAVNQIGYSPEELLGRHFSTIMDKGTITTRERVLNSLEGSSTGADAAPKLFDERRRGDRKTQELEISIKGGGPLASSRLAGIVTASGEVVMGVDGSAEVVGTIGVIREVSTDARASAAVRKLFAVADAAPDGILLTDAALSIEYANAGFYRTFGLAPLQVIGHPIHELQVPGFGGELVPALRRAANNGSVYTTSTSAADSDEPRFLLTGRPVFRADGEASGFVITLTPERSGAAAVRAPAAADPVELSVSLQRAFRENGVKVALDAEATPTSVAPEQAHRIVEIATMLSRFASLATGSDESRVTLGTGSKGVKLFVDSGGGGRDSAARPDPGTLEGVVAEVESLRSSVLAAGGSWTIDREPGQLSFTVELPELRKREPEGGATEPSASPAVSADRGFDYGRFAAGYAASPAILEEIIALYLVEAPERVSTIREALADEDLEPVVRAAHSLANTSGTLLASDAVALSRSLEIAAREKNLAESRRVAAELLPLIEAMISTVKSESRTAEEETGDSRGEAISRDDQSRRSGI